MYLALTIIAVSSPSHADEEVAVPVPLHVEHVVRLAKRRRDEVIAARASAAAAAERPAIVSALDDPQVFPSIVHVPFVVVATRATAAVIAAQHGLADQMAATARYATSTAVQADVLRRGSRASIEMKKAAFTAA